MKVPEAGSKMLSSGRGTRTPDTRIMIPPRTAENAGKQALPEKGAARTTAAGMLPPDVRYIAENWERMSEDLRSAMLAMIQACILASRGLDDEEHQLGTPGG